MSRNPTERLQKVMAHAGVASRRKSEELIRQGRVTVNGQIVTQLGTKVDVGQDEIRLDGSLVQIAPDRVYILVNKPRGVLSVMHDDRGRRSLGDLVQAPSRLFPVGRLDATSEGLILLTDDGELTHLLTHPRYRHDKEYLVLVHGSPRDKTLEAWRRGVILEGQRTAPARVTVLERNRDSTLVRVVMREGRKRQIREVASILGHPVLELKRVRLGPLLLGTLQPGQWRHLTPKEIQKLETVKKQAKRSSKSRKQPSRRRRR
jgi:23S rRNA pseudouridine2605 synthase